MSLQIQLNATNILGAFQKVGLYQGQAYQDQQIFEGLDKLSGSFYDREVGKQLFEQCAPNQRGQVLLEEFSKKVIEADKILKKKIQQTEELILQHQEEAKECQKQFQEAQYTQQKNQHGIERDSTLNLIIQSADRISFSDYLNSLVVVAVDNSEQTVQQLSGDKATPIYNNQITFQIQTGKENVIVSLFVQDRNSRRTLIGQQKIDLKQIYDQQVHSLQLQLQNERTITTTIVHIDAQWIHDKLKYYQEMIFKYEQLIQQSQQDIDDYKRDLYTVQQPYLDSNVRNNLQSSIKPLASSKVSPQTNNALYYQQHQGQQQFSQQQQQTFSLQQDQMIQIKNQQQNFHQIGLHQDDEISDELYYGFILYCVLVVLSLFQCFARPAYLDIMLGMLYLLIVCRDCLNAEYLKFVGGFTIGTVVLDLVWISIYKNWWSGTDITLPTWGTSGVPIVRITIVFCIFSMILKTALCYILFHYYKAAQANQTIKFQFQQLEFQVGQIKQNLFTLDKQLLA